MLGVEDYGSDNESGDESVCTPKLPIASASKQPPSSQKPTGGLGLALPPPSAGTSSKPTKKTKKIAIGLPSLSKTSDDEAEANDDQPPPAKKARLENGAGRSSLLSMLPAPKQKAPILPKPERVLGGGQGPGLVFNTSRSSAVASVPIEEEAVDAEDSAVPVPGEDHAPTPSTFMLPSSLRKGKANVSLEDPAPKSTPAPKPISSAPAVDFFSLGSTSSSSANKPSVPVAVPSKPSIIPTRSAAPALDDFTPPEPTPSDPYPGYYQLPSGGWAQYDTAYYQSFYKKWQKDYEKYIRNLEKGKLEKGFEDLDRVGISGEVDPVAEMEKAKVQVKELEERKQLTHGAGSGPEAPRMNVQGAKLGGRARSRHQLTTLLTEAYQNRETLEEKIAQGRRNRKEAGMKYGELYRSLAVYFCAHSYYVQVFKFLSSPGVA
ncbi:hypothetical protein PUNSTDRAFT_136020 [Punctularia strigosozonata HHB-11173 SS5]|uniref:uncharacterized protein n=1 Tax=Punctularia strigosozonata (strain HHB-11173) TaxID=741275 RepID=UPI0004416462|nr:uncharacterized protein PUNSTDRAFT_136020 [Punctularia strigosozonata HHB-11173 SS5]EIN07335.1 hypothetical protein PUNSTDRAFT_136020 [Punctularia strigosozonata HHB-11173 SS5]